MISLRDVNVLPSTGALAFQQRTLGQKTLQEKRQELIYAELSVYQLLISQGLPPVPTSDYCLRIE